MPKVADIATIRNGFAFRGRIESDRYGDTRVIQASDLTQGPGLQIDALACVQLGKKAQRYHLLEHDIVFMARGIRQRAYRPIRQAINGMPIITAFGLLVIRPKEALVLSDYLLWVLNTQQTQQRIQSLTEGSNISFISDRNFSRVDVPLPSLATQHKIAGLINLHQQRNQVREKLAKMDDTITQATAWSLATETQQ